MCPHSCDRYATLGEPGLQHSPDGSGCVAIFTNEDLLSTVLKVLLQGPSSHPILTILYITYDGAPSAALLKEIWQNGHIVLSQDASCTPQGQREPQRVSLSLTP